MSRSFRLSELGEVRAGTSCPILLGSSLARPVSFNINWSRDLARARPPRWRSMRDLYYPPPFPHPLNPFPSPRQDSTSPHIYPFNSGETNPRPFSRVRRYFYYPLVNACRARTREKSKGEIAIGPRRVTPAIGASSRYRASRTDVKFHRKITRRQFLRNEMS